MRLIDADVYCATICRCNRRACDRAKCPIHNAPTAYDIDKVVEELESDDRHTFDGCINKRKAIEIVKQGGVSDDVCEWKAGKSNDEWQPNCEPNSTYNVFGVAWFRKCPYCGKKIKVVEV